jgi:hypothetical protein
MPDRKEIRLQIGTNVIQTGAAYDWNCVSVQGDDYMDVDVSLEELAAGDGSYEKNIRYEKREIEIHINSRLYSAAQIDATELLLKSYLDSKAAGVLTIYKNGVERTGYGRIESVKKPRKSKWNERPYVIITFVMPNPWFLGEQMTNPFYSASPLFSFPLAFPAGIGVSSGFVISGNDVTFTVAGHDAPGFVLTLTASGAVVNPKVMDSDGKYVIIKEPMVSGDVAVISTVARDKFTTLNGEICRYDKLSDFFTLKIGSNTLTVSADSGIGNLTKSLAWRERYRG